MNLQLFEWLYLMKKEVKKEGEQASSPEKKL